MILAVTVATAVVSPFGFVPTAMDVVVAGTADSAGSGS
jgi:hypothetical protein